MARKTAEERLKEISEREEALKKRLVQIRAQADKLRAGQEQEDRKRRTKQAIILGSMLFSSEFDELRLSLIARLTRPQDLAAFQNPAPDQALIAQPAAQAPAVDQYLQQGNHNE